MFLLLRNKYESGHYHSKQEIPEWYTHGLSNWYRDLKKMHDLGLINLGRNGKGFRLTSLRHGLEANSQDRYVFGKIEYTNLEQLIQDFEDMAIIKNLSSQHKKRVYKKFRLGKKSNITKTKRKAIKAELKSIKNTCVDKRLNRNYKYATFLSCRKAGELIGGSAYKGKEVLDRLLKSSVLKRKIQYLSKGLFSPNQAKEVVRQLAGGKFPLLVGKIPNKHGKVHIHEKIVTVALTYKAQALFQAVESLKNLVECNKTAKM